MRWPSHQIFHWTRTACHWTCPACHTTRPACHWTPELKLFWGDLCFIGPVQHFIGPLSQSSLWGGMKNFLSALKILLVGNLKHFVSFISYDPSSMSLDQSSMSLDQSSMSLDQSSMSLDPRVKTIFGRPLFHWTCQEFHLTPVSIVALGWNEKFSLAPC
ncbi:hypothetical protein TNCV_4234381 [Trichonephila clavipes]|nr:hypothetical protein TNCV_4234381 [Trichonephila clavipes]